MKKIILGLVVILTVGMATAQEKATYGFAKKDVFLGGSLSGYSTSDDSNNHKYSNLFFYPTIAYFIKDNFAIGMNFPLGYIQSEYSAKTTKKSTKFGIS